MWVFWEDTAYSVPASPGWGEDTLFIRTLIQPGPCLKPWQFLEFHRRASVVGGLGSQGHLSQVGEVKQVPLIMAMVVPSLSLCHPRDLRESPPC